MANQEKAPKQSAPDFIPAEEPDFIPAEEETPKPPAPMATISASPDTASDWWQNAEEDLRHGGSRTAVGKILGIMQGRGDKGYGGLEAGESPETADFMGSPLLGIAQMGRGGSQVIEGHPLKGAGNILAGGAEAATIPSMVMAGPVAHEAVEAIPSAKYAGHVLETIRNAAKDVPVSLQDTMPELERWSELSEAGGKSSKPVTSLGKRASKYLTPTTSGKVQEPILFPEARDYYSNVSDISRQSPLQTIMGRGLKPTMLRQAGKIRSGLNADLTRAAGEVGQGENYANALKEYARAAKLRKLGILGGAALGEEALRRSGILGKVAAGATQTLK